MAQEKSPRISFFKWGVVHVEGYENAFRDVKVYPGGAHEWDWSITNMHHQPGIQPIDVEELLKIGIDILILSKGVDEKLYTMPETLVYLQEQGIETYVLQTEAAIQKYNELCESHRVAALIHSTC
jgi:hypothetical protein